MMEAKYPRLECSFGHKMKQSRGPAYVAMLEEKIKGLEERLQGTTHDSDSGIGESRPSSTSNVSLARISSGSQYKTPSASPASPNLSGSTNSSFSGATNIFERPGSSFGISQKREHPHISAPNTSAHARLSQDSSRRPSFSPEVPRQLPTSPTHSTESSFGLNSLRQICTSIDRRLPPGSEDITDSMLEALKCSPVVNTIDTCPSLPEQAETKRLVEIVFKEALHLWPFLSQPQVEKIISKVYGSPDIQQQPGDRDDLALLLAIVALGQRFDMGAAMVSHYRRYQG